MTIISLLDLPLDLPPDVEARHAGLENLISGLPEYLSRSKNLFILISSMVLIDISQAKPLKAASPAAPGARHMAHMPFAH